MGLFPIALLLFSASALVPTTLQEQELEWFLQEMSHNSKKISLIKTSDGLYRWVAREPISRGEPILGVMFAYCLTSFEAFPLTGYISDLKPDLILTVRLLYEKFMNQRGGFVNSYVHSLASNLTQMALWSDEERDRVKHEINFSMQINMQSDMTNSYYIVKKRLKNANVPAEMMEWDAWTWAFMHAQSKAFQLDRYTWLLAGGYPAEERDKAIYGGSFYPLIDLIPHFPLPTKLRNPPPHTVVMQGGKAPGPIFFADRDYAPKQLIVHHIRNMTNYELLYLHGYVIDYNVDDSFEVSVGDDSKCPGTWRKSACWFELNSVSFNYLLLNWLRLLTAESVVRATEKNMLKLYLSQQSNETQAKFTGALVKYRRLVVDKMEQTSSVALRSQVRALQLVNDTNYQLMVRLGVSQKRVMYRHLALADREMMRLVMGALGIRNN